MRLTAPARSARAARRFAWLVPALILLNAPASFAHDSHGAHVTSYGYSSDDNGQLTFAYALVDPAHDEISGATSSDDWRSLERLMKREPERFLWLRIEGRSCIVRDHATLERADALMEPQRKLGEQQEELGGREGALGAQQDKLGAEQGRLGARQGRIAADLARLEVDEGDLDAAGRAELDRRRAAYSREQDQIGRQVDAIGRQMDQLGRQMDQLGRQMDVLDRQEESLSQEADTQMRQLANDAISKKLAQPITQ